MLNIVIFGAPGSGKGTQSRMITEKYGLHHISTGDILRAEIEAKTELGVIADEYIRQGQLVPDHLVIDMFADLWDKHQEAKGFIYDGFPRTLPQAKALDDMLRERGSSVVAVLNLNLEDEEIVDRLLKRGEMSGRSDDNLETIQKRIAVYKEQTEPLKDYYKKQGKMFKIKGHHSVETVFEEITQVIDRLI
jgi:adenylate kinase